MPTGWDGVEVEQVWARGAPALEGHLWGYLGEGALGGGLGHLTRARKVLEALGRDAVILTASPFGLCERIELLLPHTAGDSHAGWLGIAEKIEPVIVVVRREE